MYLGSVCCTLAVAEVSVKCQGGEMFDIKWRMLLVRKYWSTEKGNNKVPMVERLLSSICVCEKFLYNCI